MKLKLAAASNRREKLSVNRASAKKFTVLSLKDEFRVDSATQFAMLPPVSFIRALAGGHSTSYMSECPADKKLG
jgi:hypothetical protein